MNILITSGGTSEKIDNVRKITNSSTGKLGCAVAEAFKAIESVNNIWYVCGINAIMPLNDKTEIITVGSAADLLETVSYICDNNRVDVVVHAMAVSDYYVKSVSTTELISENIAVELRQMGTETTARRAAILKEGLIKAIKTAPDLNNCGKIPSDNDDLVLILEKTPKVLPYFRKALPHAIVIGFKLLDSVDKELLISTAHKLLVINDCDFVLANDLSEIGADRHTGHLIDRNRAVVTYYTKAEIADGIVKAALYYRSP